MKKHSRQHGFTLVELMVALSLFTIVVLAAVSSLYSVNNASRKVTAMRSVLDNLNFAIESMSRTIRTGSGITCGGTSNQTGSRNCEYATGKPSGQLLLNSTLGEDQQVEYRWWTHETNGNGNIEKRIMDQFGTWSNWISLTSPEIDVEKLEFYVDGAEPADLRQPSVIIFVQGVASAGENISPFAIQTYISQRSAE